MKEKTSQSSFDLQRCITRIRAEDQAAFGELLEAYAPLIGAAVARYGQDLGKQDREELEQLAWVALYRAAMSYDLERNEVEFGLYAKICVSNALNSQMRLIRRQPPVLSIESDFVQPASAEDPAARVIEQEEAEALYARVRALLSPYENRVWNLFMAGHSAGEIAKLLQKDTHSIENAVYRIRQKLRRELAP